MERALSIPLAILICGCVLFASDQGKKAKEPPPPKAPAVKAAGEPGGGTPKVPNPKLGNPGSIVQQLFRMSPEDRERAMEKLPPQQQERLRTQLEKLDKAPPAQRALMLRMANALAGLPPEKQIVVVRELNTLNNLPQERRQIIIPEVNRLRRMPEDRRMARIMSDDFRNTYTPEEQQMMIDIAQSLPVRQP